jgi:phosphoribosylanthranilate isomerase
VCGLTCLEDARVAAQAGADFLGFVVFGDSPRRVSADLVGEIVPRAPGPVMVAVMVRPTPDQALQLARRAQASRIQLHGVGPDQWPEDFPMPCLFAVGVGADGRLTGPLPSPRHLLLLDTSVAGETGGSGRTFPWAAARALAGERPVVLAGGLGPDNVADAIRQVRPFMVDASSRLEREPGRKDPERVRRYLAAVRECDEGRHEH